MAITIYKNKNIKFKINNNKNIIIYKYYFIYYNCKNNKIKDKKH